MGTTIDTHTTIERHTTVDTHTTIGAGTPARVTEGTVTVNGLRLHHRDLGDDDAPPVVVLHGIMGHCREWDVLVDALAADGRVVAVDQRGHGRSDRAEVYTPSLLADDVVGLIEALRLGLARLVGHSMGGMAAMLAAARRPDLVERLVVIDIGPDTVRGELAEGLRAFVAALGAATYASVEEAYAEWSGDPLARPSLLRHYVEHCLRRTPEGRLAWRFDGVGLGSFFDSVDEAELWDAVDAISCPVLLARGQHSPALSPETAAAMVRRLRDGRLVVIPHAAHDLGVQQPEAVAAATRRFLAGGEP